MDKRSTLYSVSMGLKQPVSFDASFPRSGFKGGGRERNRRTLPKP